MLLTFLIGLSGCFSSTSADARVNDHPSADEELHVLTIGTADSGRNHVSDWRCHRLCFKRT